MVEAVFPIEGVIRRYDWGSRTAIQELLGTEPDGRPAAELWFGAHAGDPSPALDTTLDRLIAADAAPLLGDAVLDRFGPRLPFLLKVLAAERALSIQVHPNLAQARAGYAAEEAAGIAGDAPERNYADPNHKPELLCALSPFEALCGFRPIAETLAVLADLDIPELAFVSDHLGQPDGLRAAFTALLTHPDPGPLAGAVAARADAHGPLRATWLAAHDFPGDIGVVLTLLLNYVRLEPGEAIYLAAGNVHAYLRGTGVEIMANSDNVLRCGLTPKHIDIPELLKITDFSELPEPRWAAQNGSFTVPVPDFQLRELRLVDEADLYGDRPRIVLCVDGTVAVQDVDLTSGHAAFLAANAGSCRLRGTGQVFIASSG
jgi:mannose-6-phosphate isomerase